MFKSTMNFTRGFTSYDFIRGQESDPYRMGNIEKIDLSPYVPEGVIEKNKEAHLQQYLLNIGDRKREEDYFAPQVFNRASRWVKDNEDNKPFFLWIDSFDPHEPWDPPKKYADQYYKNEAVKDFIYPYSYPGITEEEKERTKALYYGEVTLVDKYVGIFLEVLRDLGLLDDTIVILASDHGTELWDINRFGKSLDHLHAFNSQLNLFIRHPDAKFRGRSVGEFVQNHDLMPTLLDLLEIKHPAVDGHNFWLLVTGEAKSIRDFVIDGWGKCVLVRDKVWSYMTNYTDSIPGGSPLISLKPGESLLYNLEDDPKETENLSGKYPEVERMMDERLEDFLGSKLPYEISEKTIASPSPIDSFVKAREG